MQISENIAGIGVNNTGLRNEESPKVSTKWLGNAGLVRSAKGNTNVAL